LIWINRPPAHRTQAVGPARGQARIGNRLSLTRLNADRSNRDEAAALISEAKMTRIDITPPRAPELSLNPDDAFFILMKAREFDEKMSDQNIDDEPSTEDGGAGEVFEDQAVDATEEELIASIRRLNDDAQLDLLALVWIGRGDFALAEWPQARDAARDIGRERIARYLCGIPMVSDYLDEALAQIGFSLEDYMANG
jgi:hypothetical protein